MLNHVSFVQKPSAIRVDQLDRLASATSQAHVTDDASAAVDAAISGDTSVQSAVSVVPDATTAGISCVPVPVERQVVGTCARVTSGGANELFCAAGGDAQQQPEGGTTTAAARQEEELDLKPEKEPEVETRDRYPVVVHFALRPLKLTIYREPKYQRLYKQLTKLHYLLMNKRRITRSDRAQLQELCKRLEQYHSER